MTLRAALLTLLPLACTASPPPTQSAARPASAQVASTPPASAPVARAPAPPEPPLDPAAIRIATRIVKNEDCGTSLDDYLKLSSKEPNRLTVRWLEQNMGEPFRARVVVRPGAIRLEIDAISDPLGGMICGLQAYHLRTEITGLPAGSYRVLGPRQPYEQVNGKLIATPRAHGEIAVAGREAPLQRWRAKIASRRFDP